MLNSRYKLLTLNVLFNLFFWVFLFMFILAIRYYDIGNIAFIQKDIKVPLIRIYGNAIFIGVFVAIPYSLMEIYLKNRGLYEYSLARIIVNRMLIQFAITASVLTIIAYINFYLDIKHGKIDPSVTHFDRYIFSATVQFLFLGALLGNIILSILRTLQQKIGSDIFFQLLVGKYRPAKEEERAFMFLDLKSSTTIAEQLGHHTYSYFIQDCFKDLHPAILSSKAMVYQYVGDEAVLTWTMETAISDANCLKAYFSFSKRLDERSDYYQNKYGVVPTFKAGLNIGPVMAAEVGVVKREIAYHSDVLNTAARVQGQCNDKNASFLVTENIVRSVEGKLGYQFNEKGRVRLRGKNEDVTIYEVIEENNT